MKTWRLLLGSLCANALLAVLVVCAPRKMPILPGNELPAIGPANQISTVDTSQPLINSPPPALLDTGHLTLFHWSQLESADYRVFVANLRAVGCPEATVRDIVVPDVNEVFYGRVKQIVDTVQNRFWEMLADQKAFEKMVDEKHKELDDLEKERDSVLQELLGPRANHRMQRDELAKVEQLEQRKQFLDFLPAEKIEQCLAMDARFDALREELNNADPPLESKELQSRSKHLLEQQKSEFEALLSPNELTEDKLRNSRFANLRFQLNGFDASEAEVREMVRTQELSSALTPTNSPAGQRDALKSLLGRQRFGDYERTLDNRFQEFYQVADRYDLPVEKAAEAYEIRTTAEAIAQKVRADQGVAAGERAEQLAAIQGETERAIAQALGESAFGTYRSRSGQWIEQLAGLK